MFVVRKATKERKDRVMSYIFVKYCCILHPTLVDVLIKDFSLNPNWTQRVLSPTIYNGIEIRYPYYLLALPFTR